MLSNAKFKMPLFVLCQLSITGSSFLPFSTNARVINQIFALSAEGDILHNALTRTELFIFLQFVAFVITVLASSSVNENLILLIKVPILWCMAVALFHLISWFYGAPAFESFQYTLHLSSLMASLTVIPYSIVMGTDFRKFKQIFLLNRTDTAIERTLWCCIWGAVVGAWLGAFPIPLDWDRPWQVWPVSCLIGAVSGYVFGFVISGLFVLSDRTKMNANKYKFL